MFLPTCRTDTRRLLTPQLLLSLQERVKGHSGLNGAVQSLSDGDSRLGSVSFFMWTFPVPSRSIPFRLIRCGLMLEGFPLVCAAATSESMAAQFGHTKSIFLREKPTRNYLYSYPYKVVVRRKHSVQY